MELLLEIGTEEIPSSYILNGLRQLKELCKNMLNNNRIDFGDIETYGTPRRIVLIIKDIADKQKDTVLEIKGPPKSVSFDKNGNPTKAALSFVKKNDAKIDDIEIIKTPKGEYLFLRRSIAGEPTFEVLKKQIPIIISNISWPKSMRWSDINFFFARPIHWILCLLDNEIIPFEIAGVKSGNQTLGHRFMSSGPLVIRNLEDYLNKIKGAYIILDPEKRKDMVLDLIKRAASSIGGIPDSDPELLDTVSNLVEYPFAICGGFAKRFLELPEPVIITPMKEHQKYFPVYDHNKRLMPNFIAINNTIPKNTELVKKGHERVLKARLADAEFFFKEDQKIPLVNRLEELKHVIYHAQLGSSYEKIERFTKLAEYISNILIPEKIEDVRLVCRLCKCDLVTLMVSEFPDLQGIMGREYAKLEGYPKHICDAIYEHYLPIGSFGELPKSELGAIVGIADRMDTICGCFAIGIKPSGSADPFGLRRHALSIIRIIENMNWDFSFKDFLNYTLDILKDTISFNLDVEREILIFFKDRYRYMMIRKGFPSDIIDAVLSVSFDNIALIKDRIIQLQNFIHQSENFEEIVLTAKRVRNILNKQKDKYEVDESLFQIIWEKKLWESYIKIKERMNYYLNNKDYFNAIKQLSYIKKPVDDFFDNVEILTKENKTLRTNRIALVQHIEMLFKEIADFSKFPY